MTNSTLSHADRPNLIRIEGQSIELKFDRTSPTHGRVSWNIPAPANGCAAGTQAYNGIVITGALSPADQTTAPVSGQVYKSDPSLNPDEHSGDRIGHAFVVGAVYNDLTTTFLDVTGLDPSKPYYFSAYAVDNVLTYFRGGVHSYSAGVGTGIVTPQDMPAVQGIWFPDVNLVDNGATATGLNPAQNYSIKLHHGCTDYTVTVTGADAQTYKQLVDALNIAVDKLTNPPMSYQMPNVGALYYDGVQLGRWNGGSYTPISLLIKSEGDAGQIATPPFWYNTVTDVLFQQNTTTLVWSTQPFISFSADPTQPACGMYLFNGTVAFAHNGAGWCEAQTFVQTTNPFVPVDQDCSFYWYDTAHYNLNKRVDGAWVNTPAIYTHVDPNAIPDDFYWYNSSTSKAFRRSGGSWLNAGTLIVGSEMHPSVVTPTGGALWYDPTTQLLKRRSMLNTEWISLQVVTYHADPAVRLSCEDLWWDSVTDQLKSWDELNNVWAVVDRFEVQDFDPMIGVVVDEDAVWWNPVTQTLTTWAGPCDSVSVILWDGGDPRVMPDGTIWRNTTNGKFYTLQAGVWNELNVIQFVTDPGSIPLGTYWLKTTNGMLSQWNGTAWIEVSYSTTSHVPANGSEWFNLSDNRLYKWNGSWIISQGLVDVMVYDETANSCAACPSGVPYPGFTKSGMYFVSSDTGSSACLTIADIDLWSSLNTAASILTPQNGSDGVNPLPPYMQDGVGTDGSEEERKQISRDIVLSLGGGNSGITLELTKEDIDHSIDKAIRELRRLASPYKRGFFPIGINKSYQKRWLLTNKKMGHHQIIRVVGIYRATGLMSANPTHGINSYTQPWMYGMLTGSPGGGMLTYELMAMHMDELDTLLARRITYDFNERTRILEIHNQLGYGESLLIEAAVEMTEQEIMMDRMYRSWVERWATAESRVKLAEIRGKFQSLPGPNGGIVMNASDLQAKADAEFQICRDEVNNYIVQDLSQFPGALFAIG